MFMWSLPPPPQRPFLLLLLLLLLLLHDPPSFVRPLLIYSLIMFDDNKILQRDGLKQGV